MSIFVLMQIPFYKYQATGNDFIVINQWDKIYLENPSQETVAAMCHRRFGIGGDGLILLEKDDFLDFKMIYYNANGRLGSMCGNGGRTIAHLAHSIGVASARGEFLAADGAHTYEVMGQQVRLGMRPVEGIRVQANDFYLNTGSPHLVVLVDQVADIDVFTEGARIRYSERFSPEGTNINFVEAANDYLKVRTYERGVEDETLSCGTGVTAAAIAMAHVDQRYDGRKGISIQTKGGQLRVYFERFEENWRNIFLQGPAKLSFTGIIDL